MVEYVAEWIERRDDPAGGSWYAAPLETARGYLADQIRRNLAGWPANERERAEYRAAAEEFARATGPMSFTLPRHVVTLREAGPDDYPHPVTDGRRMIWACCVGSIGRPCAHERHGA